MKRRGKPPRLDAALRRELDESGAPWSLVQGKKHWMPRVDGKAVAVTPHRPAGAGRAAANSLAEIRRFLRSR